MEKYDRRSLFLPDILPCPGLGRCDFHAAIFGQSDNRDEIPKQWFCQKCQKEHATTISPPSAVSSESSSLSHLESLPTELLLQIIDHLPQSRSPSLALTSRTLYEKIGTKACDHLDGSDSGPVELLARNMPAYAICHQCEKLRPYYSALAWPLLKHQRERRMIPDSVYAVSEFLAVKLAQSGEYGNGVCPSLLDCAGTYRKPWESRDATIVKNAGFSQEDVDLGLAIAYEASGRIHVPLSKFLTHIKYRIDLRRPWTSYTVAQRASILRKFYLCPHTFASRVQYRDPRDPTYPADSSIAHWQSHQGPMPTASWVCSQCPTEFRSVAEFDEQRKQHSIVFDVWRVSTRRCNDGMSEMTICETLNTNHRWRMGRIQTMFETARPI